MSSPRSILLCLYLLLVPFMGQGQERIMVRGKVIDALTERPLQDVHIGVKGMDAGAVSREDGSFELGLRAVRTVEVHVSRVGYAPLERTLDRKAVAAGETLVFRLLPKAVELPEVDILQPGPEVVYQREDLHVGDYFTNDDGLWVLTYERPQLWHAEAEAGRQILREARVHLLDTNFVECCSVRLPENATKLHHDFKQRPIVEGMEHAWMITRAGDGLGLLTMELETLHERVLPWTDSIAGRFLGNTLDPTFPAFDHFAYDPQKEATQVFCSIQDDLRMELFRSQYKYMSGHDKVVAMDLALETGIDAEIIAGYMTQFHKDIYFEPPYAPLFVVSDTLLVFDHHRDSIHRYLPDLSRIGQVPISYHKERHWEPRLLRDAAEGDVYALFIRNLSTWLRKVDEHTGALGPVRMLDHPFPEEVQVHGGHAYFIYRPYASLQHRALYRQRIK